MHVLGLLHDHYSSEKFAQTEGKGEGRKPNNLVIVAEHMNFPILEVEVSS